MISVSARHLYLVLGLSASVHLWIVATHDVNSGLPPKPSELTEVTLQLVDFSAEVAEVSNDEVATDVEAVEVLEPDPEPLTEVVEIPDVSEAIDVIEVVAVEESPPVEAVASESIDAIAVEIIETVAEPDIEEVSVEEPVPEPAIAAVEPVTAVAPPVTRVAESRTIVRRQTETTREVTPLKVNKKSTAAGDLKVYARSVHEILQQNKSYPAAARRAGEQGRGLVTICAREVR